MEDTQQAIVKTLKNKPTECSMFPSEELMEFDSKCPMKTSDEVLEFDSLLISSEKRKQLLVSKLLKMIAFVTTNT